MCNQKEEELKETKNRNIETSRKAFESMALIKNTRRIVGSKEENKKKRKNKEGFVYFGNTKFSSIISTSIFFYFIYFI